MLALNNLSVDLSNPGRRGGAPAAPSEAVEIYRRLAARLPDVYHDEYQRSLDLLKRLDRDEEAGDDGSPN